MSTIDWHQRAKDADLRIQNLIDGTRSDCSGTEIISKHAPHNGELLYQFGNGDKVAVDDAVSSARAAFDDGRWCNLSVDQRKAVLIKLADLVQDHRETFALYESLDVGKPISNALHDDLVRCVSTLKSAVANVDHLPGNCGDDGGLFAYQLRKPVGVVAGILGWNFPLSLACSKVGPALIMGNSLVLKPSEFTSLSTGFLAELALEAGVPPGVFNVVHGAGATVGDALAHHQDVDLLSFVGSSATGKRLMTAAGNSNMKRLLLECGGKSPYLVFDDCPKDLDALAEDIVATAFPNQGALCVAGTRLLIQESMRDQLLPKIVAAAERITPGDPLLPETTFGALINQGHMDKVLGYIASGKEQGAKLLCGGERVNEDSGGLYLMPAIFDEVDNRKHRIAREEIFGPVLSVITFKDEDEAITLANDTSFGLSSYVASTDMGRIRRVGKGIKAGSVVVMATSEPVGGRVMTAVEGHKQSGFGFELGVAGLLEYTTSTSVLVFS